MKSLVEFCTLMFAFPIIMSANLSYANDIASNEAEKLIEKHLNASGGIDALMKMETISRSGHIAFYEKNSLKENLCYHTDIVYPKKLREQIKGKKIEYDRGTDGNNFWLWNKSQYEFTEDKALIDYMSKTSERANRDMLWVKEESDNFEVISIPPSWAQSHSQCIREIKSRNSIKRIYCFDTSTGLLNALGSLEEYRLESDWQQVGNIKLPFHLTHYQNGVKVYEIQLDHAELNREISDSQFIKPSSPELSCQG